MGASNARARRPERLEALRDAIDNDAQMVAQGAGAGNALSLDVCRATNRAAIAGSGCGDDERISIDGINFGLTKATGGVFLNDTALVERLQLVMIEEDLYKKDNPQWWERIVDYSVWHKRLKAAGFTQVWRSSVHFYAIYHVWRSRAHL